MAILLTGGNGYIGLHTAICMANEGYDVIIADDFSNSKPKAHDLAEKIAGKKIPLYELDVKDKAALDRVFSENDIQCVIHFAGFKAVGESVAKPTMYYRNNLDTTLTLLETMAAHNVKKIVFSSSATVYGIPEKVPLVEGMPTSCTNPYGWTKYMIEQILRDVTVADKDFTAILLRYFNPIGAHESGLIGEEPQGIPNNLMPYITQVAVGKLEKLRVFGNDYPTHDGTGVRDYIHVMDLAMGHVKAVDFAGSNKGEHIFNLGTGIGYSVLDIVHAFEKVNGLSVPYEIVDRRPGDIAECYADPKKANEILGWKAERSLEDMCRDSWRFQQSCKE